MLKLLCILLFTLNIVFLTVEAILMVSAWSAYLSLAFVILSAMVWRKGWFFHVCGLSFQYLSIMLNMLTGFNPLTLLVITFQVFLLNTYMVMLFGQDDNKVATIV